MEISVRIVLALAAVISVGECRGQVFCQECTIEKSMDNRVISVRDEATHQMAERSRCEEYGCTDVQDWCLVTHYKMKAYNGKPERKLERHECGNRDTKERDVRCKLLIEEDRERNVIAYCNSERSGSCGVLYTLPLLLVSSLLYWL